MFNNYGEFSSHMSTHFYLPCFISNLNDSFFCSTSGTEACDFWLGFTFFFGSSLVLDADVWATVATKYVKVKTKGYLSKEVTSAYSNITSAVETKEWIYETKVIQLKMPILNAIITWCIKAELARSKLIFPPLHFFWFLSNGRSSCVGFSLSIAGLWCMFIVLLYVFWSVQSKMPHIKEYLPVFTIQLPWTKTMLVSDSQFKL